MMNLTFTDALLEHDDGFVMKCAGALMVEHPLMVERIERVDGTKDSLMGLCKAKTRELLTRAIDDAASRNNNRKDER
jgi:septum formation protein|eukprot:30991-Pelagococcus_subviridis.AAC.3